MRKYFKFLTPIVFTLLGLVLTVLPANAAQRRDQTAGDPIGNYFFRVELDGVAINSGPIISIDGLGIEQEVIEYQNGDDPLTRKRPGRVKYGEITITALYTQYSTLNDWIEASRLGNGDYSRKNMSIILSDNSASGEVKRWNFFECFPKSWKLSTLDGKGNDVLTEEIVIVVEWFEEA